MPSLTGTDNSLEAVTPEFLQGIVRRIVDAIDPERIILFGSFARGDVHGSSDIDLFIVKEGMTHRREVARKIYELLSDVRRDFDILVVTPQGAERALQAHNSFVKMRVLEEGRVLYERRAA